MPKTATPRKPETVSRKLAETRNTSKNRSLSSLLGIGDNEKRLATDLGSGLNDVIGRGTIAGLLGLPGDLGGAAENGLRSLLGLPQVVPYGGSEHIGQKMEQAGLVSDVRRPKTELLASLISPAQAATAGYKAPQMARAGVKVLDNLDDSIRGFRMSDGRYVPKGQAGMIDVWHGTDVAFDRPNTPLFLGDRATAESYAKDRAMLSGADPVLMGGTADFKKTATDADVKRVANSLGIEVENDMAFSVLDPNISGRQTSQKVIDALRANGFDSAHIDDFSPDDPTTLTKSYVAFSPDQLSLKPQGLLGKMVAPQDEALRVAQGGDSATLSGMGNTLKPTRSEIIARAKAIGISPVGKNDEILSKLSILERDPSTWSVDDFSKVADELDIHQDFRGSSQDPEALNSILSEGLRSGMSDNLGHMYSKKFYTYGKGLSGGRSFIFPSRSIKYVSDSNPRFAPGNKPLFYMDATEGQDIYEAFKTAKRNPNYKP